MRNQEILDEAIKYNGIKEIPGKRSNRTILGWITKYFPWVEDDSKFAWCGVFMGFIFDNLLIRKPGGHAASRNWLNVGRLVHLPQARPGDIVVFWRITPDDWRGHVGIFLAQMGDFIAVYGGNQGNEVNIKFYPTYQLRGIRRIL